MVTRRVARYAGTQAVSASPPALAAETEASNQTNAGPLSPEEILRRSHANSIAGVIDQIAQVAAHALDMFNELRIESGRLSDRFQGLADRVDVVAAVVLEGNPDATHKIPRSEVTDRVLHVPELSFPSQPRGVSAAMQTALDRCEPLPPLEVFAEFCSDITPYRKKYTNPEFFKEDWMQRETFRQQHDEHERGERRRHRKEQRKSLAASNPPVEGGASPAQTGGETEKERLANQQKLKFLNIRSWRERYGTGEGKELLKPPVPRDSKHLPAALTTASGAEGDGKKTRRSLTRKSKSIVRELEDDAAAVGAPESPDAAQSSPMGECPTPVGHRVSMSDVPHTGAFMQEIEDPGDDLLDLDEFHDAHTTAAVMTGDTVHTNQRDAHDTEFADHGLSYFDPHRPEAPPPPPPPPPPLAPLSGHEDFEDEEEDSWRGGTPPPPPTVPLPLCLSHEYEEVDAFQPPPPPPPHAPTEEAISWRGSFVPPPPPPPPPPPTVLLPTITPAVKVRPPNFLHELQLRRSELRHVDAHSQESDDDADPPPSSAAAALLSPQKSLLEQIRMQQLRPVPPRPQRVSAPTLPHLRGPFASSIARILERREMTAYDSDPSDKSDHDSDSDSSEWK